MQLVPFPLMNPLQPSSVHIFFNALHIESLYSSLPALCTWYNIFNLSSGDTTVLDTAPATPPARKAAVKGWETCSRTFHMKLSRTTIFISFAFQRTSRRLALFGTETLGNRKQKTPDLEKSCPQYPKHDLLYSVADKSLLK